MEVSIWVPVIVALVAGLPGLAAVVVGRRTSEVAQRTDHLAKATEGFADLVEDLRLQLDRERKECQERIATLAASVRDHEERLKGVEDEG